MVGGGKDRDGREREIESRRANRAVSGRHVTVTMTRDIVRDEKRGAEGRLGVGGGDGLQSLRQQIC